MGPGGAPFLLAGQLVIMSDPLSVAAFMATMRAGLFTGQATRRATIGRTSMYCGNRIPAVPRRRVQIDKRFRCFSAPSVWPSGNNWITVGSAAST